MSASSLNTSDCRVRGVRRSQVCVGGVGEVEVGFGGLRSLLVFLLFPGQRSGGGGCRGCWFCGVRRLFQGGRGCLSGRGGLRSRL